MVYRALFNTFAVHADAERAHRAGFAAVKAGRFLTPELFPVLRAPVEVMGIEFPHRFGLAAGFDKNATGVLGLSALGFGHIEVGTVTALAQPGNPAPRLFRLPADDALINRMGFNNDGAAKVAARLHRLRKTAAGKRVVVGVNIGKSKVTELDRAVFDYTESARLLAPYADYIVVNVSSPNTPGLRDLQAVESLEPILAAVVEQASRPSSSQQRGPVPVVVKIAPDLADEDVDQVADLALQVGLAGISATNTTIARPSSLRTPPDEVEAMGAGGLSGPPVAPRAIEVLSRLRERVGDRLALFGVGGITTPEDVKVRIEAGADLVQGYTGFIYQGPGWPALMANASVAPELRR